VTPEQHAARVLRNRNRERSLFAFESDYHYVMHSMRNMDSPNESEVASFTRGELAVRLVLNAVAEGNYEPEATT
jgi:hypothetical protein